jgi:OOP family OmpA-OmpF porin
MSDGNTARNQTVSAMAAARHVDPSRLSTHSVAPVYTSSLTHPRRVTMRAFMAFALGFGLVLAGSPAFADPAYKADTVVDFFVKSKLGKPRAVCFDDDCKKEQEKTAPKFDLLVTFDYNSDQLTPAAKDNLNQFAKALEDPRLAAEQFEIAGHTDATGSEDYNLGLSERRANAVVAYLAEKGLDVSKLKPKGFGKTQPRVADPFDPANRRVETKIITQP